MRSKDVNVKGITVKNIVSESFAGSVTEQTVE